MNDFTIDLRRVALKVRRTRIVATVGPASDSPEKLRALIEAGVNVFRLNFSHGSQEGHAEVFKRIRGQAADLGVHVAVLADLCGPKIRVGRFPEGFIMLEEGSTVRVSTREGAEAGPGMIVSEYRELSDDVTPGARILLDDGQLELRVTTVDGTEVDCEVVRGGKLKDRKGMNLPGVKVSAPALTEKDKSDARFAADLGVDWMALSFVSRAGDVQSLRALLREAGHAPAIVAKIEKPEAVDDIANILRAADGIMVARGDLGVEMEAEEVPIVQHELIRLAMQARRPVIVATQMLESMITNARPTRAEVTDVAAAAMAGADAVMLSAETAAGEHPIAAVEAMDRVLRLVEGYQWQQNQFGGVGAGEAIPHVDLDEESALAGALSRATSQLSRDLSVRAIVVPTRGGRTVRTVSSVRPAAPIVAITATPELARRLSLCWGIAPRVAEPLALQWPAKLAKKFVHELGVAQEGQLFLLVWDTSEDHSGHAPTVTILRAEAPEEE